MKGYCSSCENELTCALQATKLPSYKLPATSYQLPATSYKSQVTSHKSRVTRERVDLCFPSDEALELQGMHYKLPGPIRTRRADREHVKVHVDAAVFDQNLEPQDVAAVRVGQDGPAVDGGEVRLNPPRGRLVTRVTCDL